MHSAASSLLSEGPSQCAALCCSLGSGSLQLHGAHPLVSPFPCISASSPGLCWLNVSQLVVLRCSRDAAADGGTGHMGSMNLRL